jgi:3-oxoacyl-[acyl-carrier protein] reductase
VQTGTELEGDRRRMVLEGKRAIVTGGSLGIGRAISLDLAANGADVAFTYRRHGEEAQQVAQKIQEMGRKALALQADVASFNDAQEIVKKVVEGFGGLDILVNNAGMNWDGVIWKMTEEQWDRVLEVNLKGFFNYIRAVAPLFKEQGSGKIVNITSINGLRGKFGQTNYSASKAGVIGLTKALAREMGRYNVNVNAVAPGLIETEMVKEAPESVKEMALSEIVLGRLGQPEEVAWVITFLCSDKARHITGQVIQVDGGQYI